MNRSGSRRPSKVFLGKAVFLLRPRILYANLGHRETWHVYEEAEECWSLIQQAVAKK
jgi:hypothetical protein